MATRSDLNKDTRLRARKDAKNPNINAKAENGSSKSQRTTVSISPRRNVDSKAKRTTANLELVKEEHKKAYSKFGVPPKKNVTSDSAFILSQKSNGVASKTTKADKKPTTSVSRKAGDANETTSVSVSRLKHMFDGTAKPVSNVKQRPKSEAMHVTIEPANPPGRWSLPDYSKRGATSPTGQGHNFKPHVSKGIAAKRAKFESGGSTESLSQRRESLRLSDLVPGLDEFGHDDEEVDYRSRTKSDPGKKRPTSSIKVRRRSPSDAEALNGEVNVPLDRLQKAFDDSVVQKPRHDVGKLYKSRSAEHLLSSNLASEDIFQTEDMASPEYLHTEDGQTGRRETAKEAYVEKECPNEVTVTPIQSHLSETAPTPQAYNREESVKEIKVQKTVEKPAQQEPHLTVIRSHNRKEETKKVPFDNETSKIREATWKDEPEPPEEPEQPLMSSYSSHTIDLPSYKFKKEGAKPVESKQQTDFKVSGHDAREQKNEKLESSETHEDESEMSDDESTGSFVEHSSPEEEVTSPVSLLFHAKPSAPTISQSGTKKKGRSVGFMDSTSNIFHTYSAEEYDRGNDFIDPVTASAEWELEKRVEKMDIFSVDLEKGK